MEKRFNFTITNHQARIELGLTMNEYAVADLIYHLSNDPDGEGRWCFASKEKLGAYLGLSKQSVHTIITALLKHKLLEKNESTKYLRTTKDWYNNVIIKYSKDSLPSVKKVDSDSKDSLLPIYDKDNYNNIISKDIISDKNVAMPKKTFGNPSLNMGMSLLEELYPNFGNKKLNRFALNRLIKKNGQDLVFKAIRYAKKIQAKEFAPGIHNYIDLEKKWGNLENFAKKQKKSLRPKGFELSEGYKVYKA